LPEENDQFTLWVIAGIVGTVIRDIYNLGLKLIPIKNVIWNIASSLFISPSEVHTLMGTILGLLADSVIGATLGVIIGLTIKLTGPKNYILKGIGIGLINWLLFMGLILNSMPHVKPVLPPNSFVNILSFIGHAIFGAVTAWTHVKLAKLTTKNWKW
jgi:hypothetical protein